MSETPHAINTTALLELLRLTSPALPIGAFAYSQGLESAVAQAAVHDEASAAAWIVGLLQHSVTRVDAAIFVRLYHAWAAHDDLAVLRWSRWLRACREAQELRAEDQHIGAALARVLSGLGVAAAAAWQRHEAASFATLFSLAAVHHDIPLPTALTGYLWAWLENQVSAAIKLVPLGQSAGQRVLSLGIAAIPACVTIALALHDDEIGATAPGLAMGSAWHETQYSRLFRS